MKRCNCCLKPDGTRQHPSTLSCHWLDGDIRCPHCEGELIWFRGAPAGDLMDELSLLIPVRMMMNPDQEAAYWDWVAGDSVKIEAEVYGDLNLADCLLTIFEGTDFNGRILDLGCGPGRLTRPFADAYPDAHLIGVDSSPGMILEARLLDDKGRVTWMVNDGRTLDSDLRSIDAAYSMTMFQHIPHEAQQGYLHEIRRVLKPAGKFRLQFVYEGEEGPLSYPTPVKQMLAWCDEAGLRETDIGMGLIHDEWCWLTLVKS